MNTSIAPPTAHLSHHHVSPWDAEYALSLPSIVCFQSFHARAHTGHRCLWNLPHMRTLPVVSYRYILLKCNGQNPTCCVVNCCCTSRSTIWIIKWFLSIIVAVSYWINYLTAIYGVLITWLGCNFTLESAKRKRNLSLDKKEEQIAHGCKQLQEHKPYSIIFDKLTVSPVFKFYRWRHSRIVALWARAVNMTISLFWTKTAHNLLSGPRSGADSDTRNRWRLVSSFNMYSKTFRYTLFHDSRGGGEIVP